MKKILILTIFTGMLFCNIPMLSQETTKKDNKVSIGITFAPQFSHWHNKAISDKNQGAMDYLNSVYTDRTGLSFGIVSDVMLGEKFSLKPGVLLSIKRNESIIFEIDDPIFPGNYHSHENIAYYLDVPIVFRFNIFKSDHLRILTGAGINNKFYLFYITKTFIEDPDTDDKELYNKSKTSADGIDYHMAAIIEAGIEYTFARSFVAGFAPSFEYSFMNIRDESYISKQYYYLLGLNVYFMFSF